MTLAPRIVSFAGRTLARPTGSRVVHPVMIMLGTLLFFLPGASFLRAAQESALTFVSVALDKETKDADDRLRENFRSSLGLKFDILDRDYGAAITTLVQWNVDTKGPLVGRVTPYVYIVAEMLGANLEILGTYVSKATQDTTYHSYFVVRRDSGLKSDDLDEFVRYLRGRPTPARFVYHNKFSTSSYLLPSLYFRQMGILSTNATSTNDGKHIFIRAEKPAGELGSSDLVRLVKKGEADFAAVWDGTRSKFADDPDLLFLKLPNELPNDLLVYAPMQDRKLRDRLQASLEDTRIATINIGDFQSWKDIDKTPEARSALAALRWLTKVSPAPVPIKIRQAYKDTAELDLDLIEAARQAVRLSGTEFILFDEDFHKHFDVLWELRKEHDDSLSITSSFVDFINLPAQEFHISYKRGDRESLVTRIEEQITNGMHRVREVWPFDDDLPTVLRDVPFNLEPGAVAKAVRVTWNDYTNNDRVVGTPFDVAVAASDFHSFRLKGDGFPRRSDGIHFDFDPLGNTAYRVILIRPTQETALFRAGTYALVALCTLAAVFALWNAARRPKDDGDLPSS